MPQKTNKIKDALHPEMAAVWYTRHTYVTPPND